MKWAAALLVLVLAAGEQSDRFSIDPGHEKMGQQIDAYAAATLTCMQRSAERSLARGARSRSQMADRAVTDCGQTFGRMMTSKAGMSVAEANAGLQAMAYRAVNSVLAAHGVR